MARANIVEVCWMHPDTEEEYLVEVSVLAARPGSRRGDPGDWEPDEPAEIELLSARKDEKGSKPGSADEILAFIDKNPKELGKIEDSALDASEEGYY